MYAEKGIDPDAQLAMILAETERELLERDFGRFLGRFGSHERLQGFLVIEPELTDEEYWPLVADVWTGCETYFQDKATWQRLFQSKRAKRECMMSAAERKAFEAMPAELTVYRGYLKGKGAAGFSWTLDRAKAEWFAGTYANSGRRLNFCGGAGWSGGVPSLVSGKCRKRDVIAYLNEREESEVLINPANVYGKKRYGPANTV